ncbi:MAG: BrnT family toxin [Rhodocyclaceae bacterium]|nr:BrnT family toxin [Rhodocyclaceae bacterium]
MDIRFELNGAAFVWNERKAAANPGKHDGITFEQAATVFFDPFFRLVEAGRFGEPRDAIIGFDATGRLLFVVHIEIEGEFIRIISARRATQDERRQHEHS